MWLSNSLYIVNQTDSVNLDTNTIVLYNIIGSIKGSILGMEK